MKKLNFTVLLFCVLVTIFSCKNEKDISSREKLLQILETESLSSDSRFSVINQISQSMLNSGETDSLILFLSDYTTANPTRHFAPPLLLLVLVNLADLFFHNTQHCLIV